LPVDPGPYCRHCLDSDGRLQSFEERLERLIQFTLTQHPTLDRSAAEQRARAQMRTMPAWRDRPELAG
jgi:hypothetical protein